MTRNLMNASRRCLLILAASAWLSPTIANAQAELPGIPGKYFIKSAAAGRYLEVVNADPTAGSTTQLWDRVLPRPNQIWEIVPAATPGYVYIKSELGRYLDVRWGSGANGTLTHLWDFNGGDAQRWRLEPLQDGGYRIRSHLGTYLTPKSGGSTNGTPVWMWSATSAAAQRWLLESAGAGTALSGFADLHTHPMSHLAFGGKLIHGAPDVGTLMPAIPSGNGCRHYERPTTIGEALPSDRATHGGWGFDNTCGDDLRKAIVRTLESELGAQSKHHEEGARGYPFFAGWPSSKDVTHQVMWIDWLRRAQQGGLRVMVALAVNNATLAHAVMGPGDINADDVSSADVQIDEMKAMVARHTDFMEIARSPAELRTIVSKGKLAIVLGTETDNIGNFHTNSVVNADSASAISMAPVKAELQRLWDKGVRYVFPVHLIDNKFGGTAIYEPLFNLSNVHQNGRFWEIGCAPEGSGIGYKFVVDGFDAALAAAKAVKLGMDPFQSPPQPPACAGHANKRGLTALGNATLREMMRMGLLIDIDHMSDRTANEALDLAASVDYPVNSGHNHQRGSSGTERDLSDAQYVKIARLGGMIGLGHGGKASNFVASFRRLRQVVGANAGIGLGTDANGLWPLPGPDANAAVDGGLTVTGVAAWDINVHGVAHYGLLPDYVRSWTSAGMTGAERNQFMHSAERFAQMWERAERNRLNVK
ncbi:RICIN domain-containing protein [Aquabacterium humicola]|uniref:RICIN domain-containing protein n=1 Tax=Aquabacterium humicola TaxID=3237377 RepID=UPI0025428C06|nr:RICIN domain-containing protein [Rubrivivax pictus]